MRTPTRHPSGRCGSRRKQPYYIHAAGDDVLAFAGLYEFWRDRSRPDDDPQRWLVTCTIHDRRPATLPREAWDAWLAPVTSADEALELLREPGPELVAPAPG